MRSRLRLAKLDKHVDQTHGRAPETALEHAARALRHDREKLRSISRYQAFAFLHEVSKSGGFGTVERAKKSVRLPGQRFSIRDSGRRRFVGPAFDERRALQFFVSIGLRLNHIKIAVEVFFGARRRGGQVFTFAHFHILLCEVQIRRRRWSSASGR
jgi:hypothetical protein